MSWLSPIVSQWCHICAFKFSFQQTVTGSGYSSVIAPSLAKQRQAFVLVLQGAGRPRHWSPFFEDKVHTAPFSTSSPHHSADCTLHGHHSSGAWKVASGQFKMPLCFFSLCNAAYCFIINFTPKCCKLLTRFQISA